PFLRSGTNTIAVLATSYTGPTAWFLPAPVFANHLVRGAFLFEARLDDDWLISDTTWQATRLDGWGASHGGGISGRGREIVDARSVPVDWTTADPGWPRAIIQDSQTPGEPGVRRAPSYPYGPFGGRPIAFATPVDVALKHHGDGGWVADRITPGTIVVD